MRFTCMWSLQRARRHPKTLHAQGTQGPVGRGTCRPKESARVHREAREMGGRDREHSPTPVVTIKPSPSWKAGDYQECWKHHLLLRRSCGRPQVMGTGRPGRYCGRGGWSRKRSECGTHPWCPRTPVPESITNGGSNPQSALGTECPQAPSVTRVTH